MNQILIFSFLKTIVLICIISTEQICAFFLEARKTMLSSIFLIKVSKLSIIVLLQEELSKVNHFIYL